MLLEVNVLANGVNVMLDPNGRNVVIDKSSGTPRITKSMAEFRRGAICARRSFMN
ncbi:hypothetical protein G6L40_32935 [Rhizobium lusitanum]|nr:hypothetical protein [Rhizobium lusitanum]